MGYWSEHPMGGDTPMTPTHTLPEQPTLRDQFACAAMQGLLANPACTGDIADAVVTMAYEHADAMMLYREESYQVVATNQCLLKTLERIEIQLSYQHAPDADMLKVMLADARAAISTAKEIQPCLPT